MYTRDSAIEYSNTLIHRIVYECSRTGMPREKLCEFLSLQNTALTMWLNGSRTCQQYWVVRNAELLLEKIKELPDNYFKHNK